MARVKAQLRRYKKYNSFSEPMDSEGKETIITTSNGLVMNISAHVCIVDGTSVELTPTEYIGTAACRGGAC
jgi:two-component system response regulator VanR